MYSLYANVLNEVEKQWTRRRTKGFLLLTLLIPTIFAIMIALFHNKTGVLGDLASNLPMLMLNLFTLTLLPLFLFMTATDSFSGEVAAGTLKLMLVRPITRSKVFASKVIVLAFYIAVHLALLWISSIVSSWFVPGGDIVSSILDSMKAYTAAFLPMVAIGLIAILIAQFCSNSTTAMTVNIFIYIAAKLLPFIFPQISVWSVFSYTNWYALWVGNGVPISKLLNSFFLLLSYCIMAYTAGWILFDRKQL